jgi:hypothetical protein
VAQPWDFTVEQFAAILALQRGEPAPPVGDAVWSELLEMWMVWIDNTGERLSCG